MNHRSTALARRTLRRFSLESLEARRTMDASAWQVTDTLYVSGSDNPDQIGVFDHGQGNVTVYDLTANPPQAQNFSGVNHVKITSKLGDDVVRYFMEDTDHGVPDIDANLGAGGHNTFDFLGMSPPNTSHVGVQSSHMIRVTGGANADDVSYNVPDAAGYWLINNVLQGGDDHLSLNFSKSPGSQALVNAMAAMGDGADRVDVNFANWSTVANLNIDLGAGNDVCNVNGALVPNAGELIPAVRTNLLGQGGDDRVSLNFTLPSSFVAPARIEPNALNQNVLATVDLGDGNDNFQFHVSAPPAGPELPPQSLAPAVKLTLSGGNGNDIALLDLQRYSGDSNLSADMGAGDDFLRLLAAPPKNKLTADLRGGAGKDALDALFFNFGSTAGAGVVDLLLHGGDGNDYLRLGFNDNYSIDPLKFKATLHGSVGFDVGVAPPGATILDCEA